MSENYKADHYVRPGRIHSFAHQLAAIVSHRPRTVMEVGYGSGVVQAALRQLGIEVTTLDIDAGLDADLVGSVLDIPAPDSSFDVVSCCQVLEHVPFEQFPTALSELRRVSRGKLVLSLPDQSRDLEVVLRAPVLGRRRLWVSLPKRAHALPDYRVTQMGHLWEIGFAGTPLSSVRTALADAGWRVDEEWRVPELPWHRFFSCTS